MEYKSSGVWVYVLMGDLGPDAKYQKCANIEYARDLARALNAGSIICKGSKRFSTECGHCIRCILGID